MLQGVSCRDADFSRRVKRLAARRALQRSISPLRELGNRTVCPADRVRTAKCENIMCVPSVRSTNDPGYRRQRKPVAGANKYYPLKWTAFEVGQDRLRLVQLLQYRLSQKATRAAE